MTLSQLPPSVQDGGRSSTNPEVGLVTEAAERIQRRTGIAVLGFSLATISSYLSVFDDAFASLPLAWALLASMWIGWGLWGWGILARQVVLWGSTLATFAMTMSLTGVGSVSAWAPVASWASFPGLAAAFILSDHGRRRGVLLCVAITGLGLQLGHLIHGAPSIGQIVLIVTTALAYAMAASTAVGILRRTGRTDDALAEARSKGAVAAAAAQAASAESFRLGRVVHDGIMNTLAAVARGVPASSIDDLRRRCAHDVEGATRAWRDAHADGQRPSSTTLADLILNVSSAADDRGIDLRIAAGEDATTAPRKVADAIGGALIECLTNSAKHSSSKVAFVDIRVDPTHIRVEYREGRNSEPLLADHPGGSGISQSIHERCRRAGVASAVARGPGGASATFTWQASVEEPVQPIEPVVLRDQLLPLATAVAGWVLVLCLVDMAVNWQRFPWQWWLLATLTVAAVVAVALLAARRRAPVAWPVSVCLVVAAGALQFLSISGAEQCAPFDYGVWGMQGASVSLMLLTLLAGNAWLIVAGFVVSRLSAVLLLLILNHSYGCGLEWRFSIFTGGFAIALALSVYRVSVRRFGQQAQRDLVGLRSSRELMETLNKLDRVRQRTWNTSVVPTLPLLEAIGQGRTDPLAATVRVEAGRLEVLLRNAAQRDGQDSPLLDALGDVCLTAYRRGQDLHLTVGRQGDVTPSQADAVRDIVLSLLEHASGRIRLAVNSPGADVLVTVSFATADVTVTIAPPARTDVTVRVESDPDGTLVEISLAAGLAGPHGLDLDPGPDLGSDLDSDSVGSAVGPDSAAGLAVGSDSRSGPVSHVVAESGFQQWRVAAQSSASAEFPAPASARGFRYRLRRSQTGPNPPGGLPTEPRLRE